MRPTRVVYVENDPALRGIMAHLLGSHEGIEILLATGTSAEALNPPVVDRADAALLDLALGSGEMNGVELGIAMRQRNPNIGIVIHSQYPMDHATERVPRDELMGWSTLPKTGDLRIDEVVQVLREAASGRGNARPPEANSPRAGDSDGEVFARLTARQRSVLGLVATGMGAAQIAEQMGLTHEAVRQDLSRAYRILVPEGSAGRDRRTQAVLEYLRLSRAPEWDEE